MTCRTCTEKGEPLNELALFAGAGGGILGGKLLGWRTVCAVECEVYPTLILAQRQNDGILDPFPIWDDVRTFDGRPWRGIIDVVSGGFPCQDISAAGKGAGITGERSGLWTEMARIIGEVRPRYAFVENSPMLIRRGLTTVLGDLAALGYDARWCVLGAHHAGAPHKRDRIWIVAHSNNPGQHPSQGQRQTRDNIRGCCADVAHSSTFRSEARLANKAVREKGDTTEFINSRQNVADAGHLRGRRWTESVETVQPKTGNRGEVSDAEDEASMRREREFCDNQRQGSGRNDHATRGSGYGQWWLSEPDVGRVAHGVAARVDRLKAIGNGQVPAVAALAWDALTNA